MTFLCYPKCSTCQKAQKWLDANGIEYEIRHIKDNNPTEAELRERHKISGLPLKRFFNYIWGWTDGKIIAEIAPAVTTSPLSDAISKDLKKRGMTSVGSMIIYAYLQVIGVINAHSDECWLHGVK